MGEVCVDYLDTYRKFFDRFTSSVDPSDQLPVKVAGYNLLECEIPGAVADWALQYLEQRRCPAFLIAHLVRKVVEEVRVLSKIDPISCGFRGEVGDYLSLKLMQVCIAKLVDVCARYRDNAELSSLPPPHPMPPVTSCAIKNSRRSMEDRHVVIHDFHALFNIKGWGPASYYGVLDGHNGVDAAIYSVSHLHQYLAESPYYPANPVKALHDACCKTDDQFTIKAQRENLHGGTTAVVALLRPKERKLYVAWLGDSQAVLVRKGRPIQIVRPHKPDRPDERDRIEGMGGTVLYWGAWRVNGQLAVSRAIGDAEYKPYVTAEPDIEEITLDGTEDFLILACDGLWDFVTEQQATSAVYKQLQENPEDLEAVSHRLVALSKEQSSQDNISVVVVFLTDPAELAKRPPMETPIPNPFNGAEMFNGQSHHRTPGHPGHPGPFDDEDFGPETDVDMVDDVLLSPAIAAAKALVHGANEDDYERQRQQMKEFDDPVDLDRSRDTPTPPAHEVARDASGDNLAESGGEESEEEWNYIPGKETQNQTETKDEDDMNSQLNPDAAEFVPVSPTRLLMDDPIIASSPARGFEKTLDNIQLPSELEFTSEISQRPGDLEYSNGPKHGADFFDNFSTIHNKSKGFNPPPSFPELTKESVVNFNDDSQEHIPFDKMAAVQNMEEKVTSEVLGKANIFGMNNDFSNNAFEATNIFCMSDPMTASFMGNDLPSSTEPEDALVPGTPRSTTVEAPSSPTTDEISPSVHQTELDSPADDLATDPQKSPELISPGDGQQEGLISVQERTSSSGFESESGADEVEPNIVSNDEFITENSILPPMDLSFKPIHTSTDTNPFGTIQTSSSTTPLDHYDNILEPYHESKLETPKKNSETNKHEDQFDFMQNAPSSFVSPRLQAEEEAVPFDQLESPKDVPHFAHPPNANSSFLATELPKSPEVEDEFENYSPIKIEPIESQSAGYKTNVNDMKQDLFSDDTIAEIEETSFTTEKPHLSEVSHVDLDSTEGFLETESKIMQDESECEQTSKLNEDLKLNGELPDAEAMIPSPVCPKAVEQVLAAFDEIKIEPGTEEVSKDSDIEVETKEMKLEFESHIADSQPTPDELKNLDIDFEVIKKDELTIDSVTSEDLNKHVESHDDNVVIMEKQLEEAIDIIQSGKETNPFKMDDDSALTKSIPERQDSQVGHQNPMNSDFLNAIDQFSSAVVQDQIPSENYTQLSSSQEPHSQLEHEVTKTVSYQTLTPANEPQITKHESYITGEEEKVKSTIVEDIATETIQPAETPVPVEEKELLFENLAASIETEAPFVVESAQKIEPVQSTIVTETLITALEETSEVPAITTTEVPSSAGTPPPTPAPGLDDSKELPDLPKTDILVAAVAAAGAVAAGSAILAEKEGKKVKEVTTKKPAIGAKKPSDTTAKSTITKAPPAKPAGTKTTTTTTTTKQGITAQKPATVATKNAAAKPSSTSTATKKPITALAPKSAMAKTASSTTTKQLTASTKSVPKQLSVSKSTSSTLKPGSKPSTPTSKPTTPTTPKSPLVKTDPVKSPARQVLKSPLAPKTSSLKPTTDKLTEKKPLTNGDIKPLPKKAEVPKKPASTTTRTVTKSSPATKPVAPLTKPAPKPLTTTNLAKPKPTSATALKTSTITAKRPSTAPAGKTAIGNKQGLSAKPALNGKSAPAKTLSGLKKTDPKANAKPETKPPPIRKPEELKKEEEKPIQIQEADVTTTNGFANHNENPESLKIEDLAPMTVETVN